MPPPKPLQEEKPFRLFSRFLVLVVLMFVAGAAIWNVTTEQRIPLIENRSVSSLNLDPAVIAQVGDLSIYVAERTRGSVPVVVLHDVDVSGSVVFDGLVASVGDDARMVTVDLPGFGLSTRLPQEGSHHTAASMSAVVAQVIEDRFEGPVVLFGVGFGGEVAAEVAATRQSLVRGLVLVDVDFWRRDTSRERYQRLPWFGPQMTFTYETTGRSAERTWAPHCGEGGWCPTPSQIARRQVTATIANSTPSIHAFRNTPRASLVPDDLDRITAPTTYIWSKRGVVSQGSVDRIRAEVSQLEVVELDVFQSHLERPEAVAQVIVDLAR